MELRKRSLCLAFALACFVLSQKTTAQDWTLLGNGNASNSTSKLGTTNAVNLRLFTRNLERARLDTNGRFGIGTTTPQAALDVHQASGSQVARFNNNTSQMYIGLYKSNNLKGYVGSYAGAANDVDFGTASGNSTGRTFLTTQSIPRLTVSPSGMVGIGTTAPNSTLDVRSAAMTSVYVDNTYIGTIDGMGVYTRSVSPNSFGYGVYAEGGYVGVRGIGYGGSSPNTTVGVFGNASGSAGHRYGVYGTAGGGAFNAAGYFSGNVHANSYITISDRKFKSDITPLDNALAGVMKLKPAAYRFQAQEHKGLQLPEGEQIGLIADEVKAVFPQLVVPSVHPALYDDQDRKKLIQAEVKYEGVNYQGLIPVLVASVQEQQGQIETLKTENKALAAQNSRLEDRLRKIEALLAGNAQPTRASSGAWLEAGVPNPAQAHTTIRYQVPSGEGSARLVLTNTKGQVVKSVALTARGQGQIQVNTAVLPSGSYTCSLYVNNRAADHKQLIIAR